MTELPHGEILGNLQSSWSRGGVGVGEIGFYLRNKVPRSPGCTFVMVMARAMSAVRTSGRMNSALGLGCH